MTSIFSEYSQNFVYDNYFILIKIIYFDCFLIKRKTDFVPNTFFKDVQIFIYV